MRKREGEGERLYEAERERRSERVCERQRKKNKRDDARMNK